MSGRGFVSVEKHGVSGHPVTVPPCNHAQAMSPSCPHHPRALPHLPPAAAGPGRILSAPELNAFEIPQCDAKLDQPHLPGDGDEGCSTTAISSPLGTAGTAADGRPVVPIASRCGTAGSAMSRRQRNTSPCTWHDARRCSGNTNILRQTQAKVGRA